MVSTLFDSTSISPLLTTFLASSIPSLELSISRPPSPEYILPLALAPLARPVPSSLICLSAIKAYSENAGLVKDRLKLVGAVPIRISVEIVV